MNKTVKKKQVNDIILALYAINSDGAKNIISLRSERIGKEINERAKKLNSALATIDEEHASTDKDHNLLHEEVVITDKQGNSKKEITGAYKYTFKRAQERKKAIEKFWDEEIEIPTSVVKLTEATEDLYKKIVEQNTFITLSNLAGIILDIPVGEDGFIDEQWALDFINDKNSSEKSSSENTASPGSESAAG